MLVFSLVLQPLALLYFYDTCVLNAVSAKAKSPEIRARKGNPGICFSVHNVKRTYQLFN